MRSQASLAPDFLTDEQERRIEAVVRSVARRFPELEDALRAALLLHPPLHVGLAGQLIAPWDSENRYSTQR